MTAAERWNALVRARFDEIERLRPEQGPVGPSFWDAKADRFAARFRTAGVDEPLVAPLRSAAEPSDRVIDVGAGTGRFTLAIAPHVSEVVAVDPSRAMLAHLESAAEEHGLSNVRCVAGDWHEVDVDAADLVICAYVLPVVTEVAHFVGKLARSARRAGFVYLSGASADAVHAPFWQHFHGRPRATAPTYLDAVDVLREQGLRAETEIVELAVRGRFDDLDEAVRDFRDNLLLTPDPEIDRELASLLATWLVDEGTDGLRAPIATLPAAILSWRGPRD